MSKDGMQPVITTPRTLVGLYSYGPQSGKSTAASWLTHKRGYCRGHFASVLKNMLAYFLASFGYPVNRIEDFLNGRLKEEPLDRMPGKPTPRRLMQTLGTAWGRASIHEDIWVEAVRRPLEDMLGHQPVVFDDLRFPNEWEMLKSLGGTIVRIDRLRDHSPTLESLKDVPCEGLLCGYEPDYAILAATVEELHDHLTHLFPSNPFAEGLSAEWTADEQAEADYDASTEAGSDDSPGFDGPVADPGDPDPEPEGVTASEEEN